MKTAAGLDVIRVGRRAGLAAALTALILTPPALADELRVAVVDIEQAVQRLPETVALEEDVDAQLAELRAEVQRRWGELQKLSGELAGTRAALSETGARRRQETIIKKEQALGEFWDQESERIKDVTRKRSEALYHEIEAGVSSFARKHDYNLVFDRKSGRLLYADKTFDQTPALLEHLNLKREVSSANTDNARSAKKKAPESDSSR
jgi:Skp family chaperone for outer membrane proteins